MVFLFNIFKDIRWEGPFLVKWASGGDPNHEKSEGDDDIQNDHTSNQSSQNVTNHKVVKWNAPYLSENTLARKKINE